LADRSKQSGSRPRSCRSRLATVWLAVHGRDRGRGPGRTVINSW